MFNLVKLRLPLVRLPLEKPMSTLATRSSEINPVLPGGKDPFLYNPRKAAAEVLSIFFFMAHYPLTEKT